MPLGAIFGGRNRNTNTNTNNITNENTFSPNLTNNIVIDGLESLGATLRNFLENGQDSSAQLSGTVERFGDTFERFGGTFERSVQDGASTLSGGLRASGSTLAFGVVAGSIILALARGDND